VYLQRPPDGRGEHLLHPLCFVLFPLSDQKNITSKSGQSVTLPCRAPNKDIHIIVLEWSRADLGEEYVLVYRDEQFDPDYQHPSFKDRLDLQDRQMKDGDVSLILKDVTINDTGTYECRVFIDNLYTHIKVSAHKELLLSHKLGGTVQNDIDSSGLFKSNGCFAYTKSLVKCLLFQ
uniref:Ig-like domain-containing protein n=1 Tax=Neolamprologus brichardi TaxID=32507 RepID=A0A3Q4N9M5_NEOBR